jgi:uncharacterized protein (DUF2252 family)
VKNSVNAAQRHSVLEAMRNLKMARSAHAYVRGNASKFYEWLTAVNQTRIPEGPSVWICGDCHVGNLGPVANVNGRVEIAIRDVDHAVIGNPAHDLIRLGVSLATAARSADLSGVTIALVLEHMIGGYEEALSHPDREYRDFQRMPKSVRRILKQALKREWRHLAKERIKREEPRIPLGKRFWGLSQQEKTAIDRLFQMEEACQLITSLHSRIDGAQVRVIDAAYWIKGCSSLGRLRYAVLLRIGKGHQEDGGLCLIDIKEAPKACAPHSARGGMPANNAERVVQGACSLSPFLGKRMLATRILGREVFIRELLPQDLKYEPDGLTQAEATAAAHYLAMVIGKAHGRQMNVVTRAKWRAEFKRHRTKNLDAPSWLWESVVELLATHEVAYLEHCRRWALTTS